MRELVIRVEHAGSITLENAFMKPIRIALSLALVAMAHGAAAQSIPIDSLSPGIPVRVVLRPIETAPAPGTMGRASANPVLGRNAGVFKGRFDGWDAAGVRVAESRSAMSWSFPRSSIVSIDARTGSDRGRHALLRGGVVGAAIGVVSVFYFTSTRYHTLNPFAYGDLNAAMTRGAAIGFVAGAGYRFLRPAGIWKPVQLPAEGS